MPGRNDKSVFDVSFSESMVLREFLMFFNFDTAIATKVRAVTNSTPPVIKNPVEVDNSKASLNQKAPAINQKIMPRLTMAIATKNTAEDLSAFLTASIASALANPI